MRSHIQGVFILLLVGIVLLGMARMAAPVVSEALGDDGAIQAESSDVVDVVDLSLGGQVEPDSPLTGEEVAFLQSDLTTLGFEPGGIDGIMGPATETAIATAITDYQLTPGSSDRAVMEFLSSLVDALQAAAAGDSADADLGEEGSLTADDAGVDAEG